ncbi:MAG: DMT family transporter [Butyricicoccus sp.]|nr:DMT family transporter [Clostridiales bacterium]MDY5972549.1 DMT family transporter [Butyricicoccus sp.]
MSASNRLRANLMLLTTALIWGVAFVAQSVGMDYIGPFTFNCVRSLLGGLVLLPCIFLLDRLDGGKTAAQKKWPVLGGVCCGVVLAVASSLQQIGIAHTSVGKAGFITALYIVIVPLLGLLGGKRVGGRIWAAVALAVAGMYLLCITESFTIGLGDLLVLLCAFCFSIHILVIDHFSPNVDGVRMSCIQFFTAGILCGVPMLLFESPNLTDICAAWAPIAYAGIMSCGVAYTLQVVAQKHTDPTVASLLLSLESVISVLAGWVLLGQALSPRELTGCALSFCAIILAQLPDRASRA